MQNEELDDDQRLANLTAGATGGERRFLELQLLQIPWQGLDHPDLFSNYEKLWEAIEHASSQEVERILRILGSWFQKSLFFYNWSLKRPKKPGLFFLLDSCLAQNRIPIHPDASEKMLLDENRRSSVRKSLNKAGKNKDCSHRSVDFLRTAFDAAAKVGDPEMLGES